MLQIYAQDSIDGADHYLGDLYQIEITVISKWGRTGVFYIQASENGDLHIIKDAGDVQVENDGTDSVIVK